MRLEPDIQHGHRTLEVVSSVLEEFRVRSDARPVLVSR
jgi:hypothetical protein